MARPLLDHKRLRTLRRHMLTAFLLLLATAPRLGRAQSARDGMGSVPYDGGVMFRVWAPHADSVAVAGAFNDWSGTRTLLSAEPDGIWSADVARASVGDTYRYVITNGAQTVRRRDPRGRIVTDSDYASGDTIIYDPNAFDWEGDRAVRPPIEDLVIYEMHIGTFNAVPDNLPGTFATAIERLDHIAGLGVSAVEVIPINEFPGEIAGGYGPAEIFAVENKGYGGPDGFKSFVKACHDRGIAVLLDVVYNHWGPWDIHLHRFDAWWTEEYSGGIYFYDKRRVSTPWGARPNFSLAQVRRFLDDNLLMWLEEYRVDGFRWDSTSNIRNVESGGGEFLPDGWDFMRESNDLFDERYPGLISIAEDLKNMTSITLSTARGGAGFDSQWHWLAYPVRDALTATTDTLRNMDSVRRAMTYFYEGDPFKRVIYTESHDNISGDRQRLTVEIDPLDPMGWKARKLSTLGAVLLFTTPGVPMIFQGQEFLEPQSFADTKPLNWDMTSTQTAALGLYRDLIGLRRNVDGNTRGLKGPNQNVYFLDDAAKMLAYHRWDAGGPGDDVVVLANFSIASRTLVLGFPRAGVWRVRLNSDSPLYGSDYDDIGSEDVVADRAPLHGMARSARVSVAPYSALVFSQDLKAPTSGGRNWNRY